MDKILTPIGIVFKTKAILVVSRAFWNIARKRSVKTNENKLTSRTTMALYNIQAGTFIIDRPIVDVNMCKTIIAVG